MPRKVVSLGGIVMATIFAVSVVVTLTQFGIFGIAQGQVNITSLTPEQKAAICNPNNPKLKVVNTTESKICGIPVTVKPHLSNATSAANTTTRTGTEAPGAVPSPYWRRVNLPSYHCFRVLFSILSLFSK